MSALVWFPVRCDRCDGAGVVDIGAEKGCGCLYHQMSAECTCMCGHGDDCPTCDGNGEVAPLPTPMYALASDPPQTRSEMTRGFGWY